MRLSKMYVSTLKEAMPESEALNYRLLYKAGFVRRFSAGNFSFLPFGTRVMRNIKSIMGQAMETLDCFEINIPSAATNQEFYKTISGGKLSYKELPMGAWHIRRKIVGGIRPRLGLLQTREWENIEGFKLLTTPEALNSEQQRWLNTMDEILRDLGLSYELTDRLSLGYAGETDKLLMLPYENGEDSTASCSRCHRTMLVDSMACQAKAKSAVDSRELSLVHTPGVKSIAEVAAYLNIEACDIIKTLLYKADGKIIAVLIRGDRELSEGKLRNVLQCRSLRAATENEVFEATKAEVGFAGPIGLDVDIICDYEAAALKNGVVGANKTDHHYINAVMDRDYSVKIIADIRSFSANDICPECGGETIIKKCFILGAISKLDGAELPEKPLAFINNNGNSEPAYILEFEMNLHRLLAVLVEENFDEEGLLLPKGVAPYDIVIMAVHHDNQEQSAAAEQIYNTLKTLSYNVLYDDRAERISVKFKDSELVGIPLRITVGRKISEGMVELKYRGKEMQEAPIDDLLEYILNSEVQNA